MASTFLLLWTVIFLPDTALINGTGFFYSWNCKQAWHILHRFLYVSQVLGMTVWFVLVDGRGRITGNEYKPYGPKMCLQRYREIGGHYVYIKKELSCCILWDGFDTAEKPLCESHMRTKVLNGNSSSRTGNESCGAQFSNGRSQSTVSVRTKVKGADLKEYHTSNQFLHQACREGNLCVVQYILDQKLVDINSRDKKGRTPVMIAAERGHFAVFDFLVSQGCDLTAVDDVRNTILHHACIGGSIEIIQHILSHNIVSIESRSKNGNTPVLVAARAGYKGVIEFLRSKGCSTVTINNQKNNILHIASLVGSVEVVQYILQHQLVDIDSKGAYGRTAVILAAETDHKEIFDLLRIKACNVKTVDNNHNNALHMACIFGHINMVQHILSLGILNTESRQMQGMTPLFLAASFGHTSLVKVLVSMGCNLKAVDNFNNTILHIVSMGMHVDVVKYILEQDVADIESIGDKGRTPVLMASSFGQRNIVELLVSKGGSLNAVDPMGDTPLHLACTAGKADTVKFIISQNPASIDSRGQWRTTPVMCAAEMGHCEIVAFLWRQGCDLYAKDIKQDIIIHRACYGGHIDVVNFILDKHLSNIESKGRRGNTPVMSAAESGHRELVELLVNKGCNLKAVDKAGYNILHLACHYGYVDVVRYLLTLPEVDRKQKGKYNMTPLDLAKQKGRWEVVKLLETNT